MFAQSEPDLADAVISGANVGAQRGPLYSPFASGQHANLVLNGKTIRMDDAEFVAQGMRPFDAATKLSDTVWSAPQVLTLLLQLCNADHAVVGVVRQRLLRNTWCM